MTVDQILERAPSVGSVSASPDVSTRYQFVNTLDVIRALEKEKWYVVEARESRCYKNKRHEGYQKHLLRLRHRDAITRGDKETIEAVLTNSHDRSIACQFLTGVFRLVCENGLILGTNYAGFRMKHIFHTQEELVENALRIVAESDKMLSHIDSMKQFTDFNPKDFATDAARIMWGEERVVSPSSLLSRRRKYDKSEDLWTIFNVVQENLMKGDVLKRNGRVTQPIRNIDRTLRVNQELWDLAESQMN